MRPFLLLLGVTFVQSSLGQNPPFLAINWTVSPIQTKTPFSNLLISNDSTRVETVDSISPGLWGGGAMFAFKRWLFEVGAQPPSTWIGERPFRLRYTTLERNQIITTSDSIEAHFYHASFFVGIGYRTPIGGPNFDLSIVPYWQKQTGRFVIHDSLYTVYQDQAGMSANERNNLADDMRVDMNELTQERTRDFSIGLRLFFSYGATYKGAGLIVFLAPRMQYSYLTVKEELYSRQRSTSSAGWSYGGTVGIGLLIGELPIEKKDRSKSRTN